MTCDKDNMSLITIKSVTTPRIVTLLKGFAENRDCTQTLSANRAKKQARTIIVLHYSVKDLVTETAVPSYTTD